MMTNIGPIGLALALALSPLTKPATPAKGAWLIDWLTGARAKPPQTAPPVPVIVARPPGPPPTGPRTAADDFAGAVARREGVGLRLTTPPPGPGVRRDHTAYTDYALVGDFELSATFHDLKVGRAGTNYAEEGNTELSLAEPGRGHTGISVAVSPGFGKCFNVGRHGPDRGGMHWNTVHFPRKSDSGRVCLRRRGGELIFLVADGLNAPLVELVRHAADPRLHPIPRISTYQSHGKVPVPVDVFWTDFVIQSQSVVRGVEAQIPLTPLPVPQSYPVAIRYSSGKDILADFPHGNGEAFRAEGVAVHAQPPIGPDSKTGKAYWFLDSRYQVVGDFEVSALFAVQQLGPPGRAGYNSAAICFGLETGGPLGSVSVGRAASRTDQAYTVTRYAPTKQGGTWDTQRVPTTAKTVRIIMRRTGSELTLLTQEQGQSTPLELVRFPVTAGPIPRLRLLADQGGTPATPVDALISELTVKAERLTDTDGHDLLAGQTPQDTSTTDGIVLDSAPRSQSRKWLLLGVAAVAVVSATITAAAFLTARSRRRGGKS